jgi:DNA excision repair protein ERCC-4
LGTIKNLISYLISYDAVTFLIYLETERETVVGSGTGSSSSSSSSFRSLDFTWWQLDAAAIVLEEARARVYSRSFLSPPPPLEGDGLEAEDSSNTRGGGVPKGYRIQVEEQPKWKGLTQVLREIEEEKKSLKSGGSG